MKRSAMLFIAARFIFGRAAKDVPRDLARRAVRGAILSVAISLIPLIMVLQVADGMIQGITARYVELATYHLQARTLTGADGLEAVQEAALDSGLVRGAWLEARSAGIAFAGGSQEGVAIRAVEDSFLKDPATIQYLELLDGELGLERPVDALVGAALAERLGLAAGSAINLITLRSLPDGSSLPRVSIFIVRGVVTAGYRELDENWLFIPYASHRRVLDVSATELLVGMKIANPYDQERLVQARLSPLLPPGTRLLGWQDIERNLFASLANTRTLLLLIMAITVIVAAVNITSALSTLTMERSREIAILKCMGAGPGDVSLLFSLSGACLGAIGAVLGCAGGLLISLQVNELIHGLELVLNFFRQLFSFMPASGQDLRLLDPAYYLETIPVDVEFRTLAAVAVTTVLVSFLAALWPARRAAGLRPVVIFRKHG